MSSIGYSLKGLLGNWYPVLVKSLGNGWSKSIVLENKVLLNFDFRNEVKKSGHLDHLLQSYGQKYFDIFDEKLVCHKLDQKQKYFH